VKISSLALPIVLAVLFTGCSAIEIPTPSDIMKSPLGTESIKIGMSRQQVEALWGKPDDVTMVEDKKRWPDRREMWIYRANYGAIPVNAGYLSDTRRLYFDGNSLVEIE
jgi:hypothetical protein